MKYENSDLKPQPGDSVMLVVDDEPAIRGKLIAVAEEGSEVVIQHRGPYEANAKKRRLLPGGGGPHMVQKKVKAGALSLVYRHEAPAAAEPPAVKKSRRKG